MTIVLDSRNDYEASPTAAATRTYTAIRDAAPQTRLVMIGRVWTDAAVPPELLPVRDAVKAAGGTSIDPLADRWYFDVTGLSAPTS